MNVKLGLFAVDLFISETGKLGISVSSETGQRECVDIFLPPELTGLAAEGSHMIFPARNACLE